MFIYNLVSYLRANDNFKNASETYQANFTLTDFVFGDITEWAIKQKIYHTLPLISKLALG